MATFESPRVLDWTVLPGPPSRSADRHPHIDRAVVRHYQLGSFGTTVAPKVSWKRYLGTCCRTCEMRVSSCCP